MKLPSDPRERKAALIAAAVTFGAALVILVLLFVMTVGSDRSLLAQTSIPEMQDDEEYYLEPELLVMEDAGQVDAPTVDEAAPQPPGEPDPAPEEQPERIVKNEEPPKEQPVSNKQKLVSTPKESDVKTSTPKLSAEEEKRIASMSGKLKTDNNGARNGKESANSGVGGDGVAAQGSVSGRKMLSCPTWKVRLAQKTVVKVSITVDADGNVTDAKAISGGTENLRKECVKMAKGSKWTKKSGAKPASGTISFTIVPA